MARRTKEERRERRLDRIRNYDERMKSERISRQEKQKAKDVRKAERREKKLERIRSYGERKKAKDIRKADRKVKRLEDKLEMTTARSGKADAIYQRQLDRESAKDPYEYSLSTTGRRRKRAKKAQKLTSAALAALATKSFYTPASKGHSILRRPLRLLKTAGLGTGSLSTAKKLDDGEDAPTIYEPRLMRKALLRKKKARLENKLADSQSKRWKLKNPKR